MFSHDNGVSIGLSGDYKMSTFEKIKIIQCMGIFNLIAIVQCTVYSVHYHYIILYNVHY